MSDIKVYTVDGERTEGYFSDVISWKYMIITGSRCHGMISRKSYKTRVNALDAGDRMVKKLMKGAK
jgi:hypothetical protein